MIKVEPQGEEAGPYYSKAAIDNTMLPLAREIEREIQVEGDIHVFYEANEDFYHCQFTAGGKKIDIKVYKNLSYYVDGKEGWVGCPTYLQYDFVASIKKRVEGEPCQKNT